MAQVVLESKNRSTSGKGVARKLRAAGQIPGVLYGPTIQPIHLSLDHKSVYMLIQNHGLNPIITLNVEDAPGEKSHICMIKDVQKDVFQKKLLHIDLRRIDLTEKIEVLVPLHLEGEGELRAKGGVVEQMVRALKVRTEPGKIPASLHGDISHLRLGQTMTAGEIKLPEGVELAHEKDAPLVNIFAPRGSALSAEMGGGAPEAG